MATSIQVTIKPIASTRVIALRQVVASYTSQPPLWSRVLAFANSHNLQRHDADESACFAIYYDQGYKESDVDTEVCLPIDADAVVPLDELNDLKVYDVPALPRAATFIHKGSYDKMVGVYAQLFGWIAAQSETVCGPVREIYHIGVDKNQQDPEKLVTEIIVPLA